MRYRLLEPDSGCRQRVLMLPEACTGRILKMHVRWMPLQILCQKSMAQLRDLLRSVRAANMGYGEWYEIG